MKSLLLIIVMLSLLPGTTGATNSAADLTGTGYSWAWSSSLPFPIS